MIFRVVRSLLVDADSSEDFRTIIVSYAIGTGIFLFFAVIGLFMFTDVKSEILLITSLLFLFISVCLAIRGYRQASSVINKEAKRLNMTPVRYIRFYFYGESEKK